MANPTTNFGWQMPTATDLVTDLPADFEVFGQAVDTALVDLKGGTTGQILAKASNTNMDFTWVTNDVGDITGVTAGTGISGGGTSGSVTITNDMATTITASGDIVVGTGSGTYDNLPIGTTGQVLTADTTVSPYKVKWSTPAGSGPTFRAYRGTSDQSFTQGVLTKIQYNTEDWDTANCYDPTTNYRFTPNVAGYYSFNMNIYLQTSATGDAQMIMRKNGSNNTSAYFGSVATNWSPSVNGLVYLDGSTDYIEGFIYFANSGPNVLNSQINSYFSAIWIRS
jgi:hypothetical protein